MEEQNVFRTLLEMARKAEIIMDVTLGDANEREDEIKFFFFFQIHSVTKF